MTGELEEATVILEGGNASGAVVRVGSTVRKPWLDTSERAMAYMEAVRARGIDLPRTHGRDEQGRLVLDYVPGVMAIDRAPLGLDLVRRVGSLIRAIHDASTGLPVSDDWAVLIPTEAPDLLCHNDLATWNLVIDGDRLVFIDWDGAGPSTRLWDLAYAASAFAHLFPGADAEQSHSNTTATSGSTANLAGLTSTTTTSSRLVNNRSGTCRRVSSPSRPISHIGCAAIQLTSGSKSANQRRSSSRRLSNGTWSWVVADQNKPE